MTYINSQEALDEALNATPPPARIRLHLTDEDELNAYDTPANITFSVGGHGRFNVDGAATVHVGDHIEVHATGSVTVHAHGYAVVYAWGTSTVDANDDVYVDANEQTSVTAQDRARVETWNRARVIAWDQARVDADSEGTVHAYDDTYVEAGNGHVTAHGRAVVHARGFAKVTAYGAVTVHANGAAEVTGGEHVTVYRENSRATVDARNIIDVPGSRAREASAATWLAYHGVSVVDGRATLYKAVDRELVAGDSYGRPTTYTVGTTVKAADWRPDHRCGGGLHVSPALHQAASYRGGGRVRYLRVTADVEFLYPIENDAHSPKCKVPSVFVEAEVDQFGHDLPTTEDTGQDADGR